MICRSAASEPLQAHSDEKYFAAVLSVLANTIFQVPQGLLPTHISDVDLISESPYHCLRNSVKDTIYKRAHLFSVFLQVKDQLGVVLHSLLQLQRNQQVAQNTACPFDIKLGSGLLTACPTMSCQPP